MVRSDIIFTFEDAGSMKIAHRVRMFKSSHILSNRSRPLEAYTFYSAEAGAELNS